jgi:drug/metabolite transporter (DMT)-like permease
MGEASDGPSPRAASPLALILGFATLYLVWGSTYLAIRFAIDTLPPFLMAGVRFLAAGGILFVVAIARGVPFPPVKHWRTAVITGALLFYCGNGGVVWSEQSVPSGVAALLVTTMPLWMALFDWLRPHGVRPPASIWLGLCAGFGGMALLVGFGKHSGEQKIEALGVTVLVLASIAWALGSLIAKHSDKPASAVMGTALQMIVGGALLLATSFVSGEPSQFDVGQVSPRSLLAALYLLAAGSLLTMPVYNWLLHVVEPTLISTYAFVNPVIAVLLGWLLAGETLTGASLLSGAVIVAAVAWIILTQWLRKRRLAAKPMP